MHNFFSKEDSEKFGKIVTVLVFVLTLLFAMMFINQIKEFSVIGVTPKDSSTIDITGEGTASSTPNLATISFNVEGQGKTIEIAQSAAAKKESAALSFLKSFGIADKDIKTDIFNSYPQYNNPCNGRYPCNQNSQPTIIGYTASQSVSITVHDVSTTGSIIDGLGRAGVTGISGPNYSMDNMDALKLDARAKAIADAKSKAEVLAKQLGVKLGKIVRFTDNSSPNPMPYFAKAEMTTGSAAPSTVLPVGENKYVSDVTITYEIEQ